jgi:hypothetical protein
MKTPCNLHFVEAATKMYVKLDATHLLDLPIDDIRVATWDFSGILVIAGPVGTGKTVAAWQLARRWLIEVSDGPRSYSGPHVAGGRAKDLLTHIARTRLDEDLQGALDPLVKAMRCGFLVLDDLGVENFTEAQQAYLDEIVNARFEKRNPTVITTNLNRDQFKGRYGERITSRVLASSNRWVNMTGPDRRAQPPIDPEAALSVPGRLDLVDTFDPTVMG